MVEATLEAKVPPSPTNPIALVSNTIEIGRSEAGVKPRFRGIPDVVATLIALPAVLTLVAHAREGAHSLAAVVYGACLVLLFAVSATYHTFMWPQRTRNLLRRFDHSMVYILIAGSYTPLCLTALDRSTGELLLALVWSIAALGMLKSFVWNDAPRMLNTAIYLGMGWLMLPIVPAVYRGVGLLGFSLLGAGGIVYTLGAVVYARRWPNPAPKVFGYHEVFHLFVIVAGACHYVTMWNLLT